MPVAREREPSPLAHGTASLPARFPYVDAYLKRHREKNRSQVIGEALRLLKRQEQEAHLETAYSMRAASGRLIAAGFAGAGHDGLDHEAW